jgi:hypothetical protein
MNVKKIIKQSDEIRKGTKRGKGNFVLITNDNIRKAIIKIRNEQVHKEDLND